MGFKHQYVYIPQNYYHVPLGCLTHMIHTLLLSDPRMCSAAFRSGVVLANAPLAFRGIVVTGCQLWATTIRANPAIGGEHV
ncbi:decaprenyl diphosphate synthase [Ktedonobacter racemifer DSM 44963]|uniref:Decaprenyl diphosphate synthase n=2 Tax=Ktedonobacter racemifer TaxID=363277 RepID=D6TLW8_KTERA|nr:decaprenyl diphosphate synthase [Ktedonobacter racemifer DSM 44963]